jgi:hypothetical protein
VRSAVDRVTKTPKRVQEGGKMMAKATLSAAANSVDEASANCAAMWREQIDRLKSEAETPTGAPGGGRKRR